MRSNSRRQVTAFCTWRPTASSSRIPVQSATGDTRAVGGLVKAGAPARTQLVENPLLLSGLALAGANRRRPVARRGRRHSDRGGGRRARPRRRRVGRPLSLRHGLGRDQGWRRRVRTPPRVPGGRRPDGDHEPLVGGRPVRPASGCSALYEGRLERTRHTADAVREASLARSAPSAQPRSEHPPLLLGRHSSPPATGASRPCNTSAPHPFSIEGGPTTPGAGRRPKTRDPWETSSV